MHATIQPPVYSQLKSGASPMLVEANSSQIGSSRISSGFLLAQAAIDLPEVQDILRKLSAYNLGVCIPHIHSDSLDFDDLPPGMVQIEQNLKVSFATEDSTVGTGAVPVAWRWDADGPTPIAVCQAMQDGSHAKLPGT
jgi:hypothetical protein